MKTTEVREERRCYTASLEGERKVHQKTQVASRSWTRQGDKFSPGTSLVDTSTSAH